MNWISCHQERVAPPANSFLDTGSDEEIGQSEENNQDIAKQARSEIYKPEIQAKLHHENEGTGDFAPEANAVSEELDDSVADNGARGQDRAGNFQPEETEEENGISRNLEQNGNGKASETSSRQGDVKDSEMSGEEESSGLRNDYESEDKKQSATGSGEVRNTLKHKHLHSLKTQEILARLEDEVYNGGRNEREIEKATKKAWQHKARASHITQKIQRKHKLHHKNQDHKSKKTALQESTSHVVHEPDNHVKTSTFAPPGVVPPDVVPSGVVIPGDYPPVTSSVMMTPAMTSPMVLPPAKFAYYELKDAQKKGAVCIDGSTPGYFHRKGFGDGKSNWIIYLQGGAWCETKESCLERSTTDLGSSLYFKPMGNPGGLLSDDKKSNPAFFNWNVAYLPYCDGSSFSGNRSDPVEVEGEMLYFRGKRILSAAMDDLLNSGVRHAREVVFSGTSAGGLAVMTLESASRLRFTCIRWRTLAFFLMYRTAKERNDFASKCRTSSSSMIVRTE